MTQISNLINGSELTIRNNNAAKYISNPIGFDNKPANGGTPAAERTAVALAVSNENPEAMRISANGVELTLTRHNSTTGKSWAWETGISAEQFAAITGKPAPVWQHKGAVNQYSIVISGDCTVTVYATSGKKGYEVILGEEYITIL